MLLHARCGLFHDPLFQGRRKHVQLKHPFLSRSSSSTTPSTNKSIGESPSFALLCRAAMAARMEAALGRGPHCAVQPMGTTVCLSVPAGRHTDVSTQRSQLPFRVKLCGHVSNYGSELAEGYRGRTVRAANQFK